jgi:hypothetical protein
LSKPKALGTAFFAATTDIPGFAGAVADPGAHPYTPGLLAASGFIESRTPKTTVAFAVGGLIIIAGFTAIPGRRFATRE